MKFMVAFSSPKRSARTVEVASMHARALNAELILLRIVPDPQMLGVVAQLISTDRPMDKAQKQVDSVAARLREHGLKASGHVRKGAVGQGIIAAAKELGADLLFVGTMDATKGPFFLMKKDPIVNYLVDNCPVSLFLVRHPYESDLVDSDDDLDLPADTTESTEI